RLQRTTPLPYTTLFRSGYDEKGQIILQISDTGIGIPEKHLKNLFKGMSKLKRKGLRGEKSTGLGLYICSQIIKIHEGRIKVESRSEEHTSELQSRENIV